MNFSYHYFFRSLNRALVKKYLDLIYLQEYIMNQKYNLSKEKIVPSKNLY